MLIPLLANRAMLSADKVSMVTMVCWSLPDTAPVTTFVPAVGEPASVETGVPPGVVTNFLFKWVLMCLERWSLRMKRLGHSGQTNRFSPEKEGKNKVK